MTNEELKSVMAKDRKKFLADLKLVYLAYPNKKEMDHALDELVLAECAKGSCRRDFQGVSRSDNRLIA